MKMIGIRNISVALALSLFLSACGDKDRSESAPLIESNTDNGLATVNGDVITELDLELAINRTFSQADQILINEQVRKNVLDSLIAAKAMSQAIASQLSEDDLLVIQGKVAAYKEELMVKEYLSRNVVPEPVTTQMVEDYYSQNPEKFGGGIIRYFEFVKASKKPTEPERALIMANVEAFSAEAEWKSVVDTLNQDFKKEGSAQPLELRYQSSRANAGLLGSEIENILSRLKVGEHSGLMFIKGIPHMFRVFKEEELIPKPLHEVSGDIRKLLAPLQLRKAVKQETESVTANAKVTYK